MRFKATIDNVTLLTSLLQSAEKMGKRAILKLTEDTLFLICAKGEGDVQMWSNIPTDNIFSEYRIQSNSSDNSIALEISITPLVQALRSGSSKGGEHRESTEVGIKLVKRDKEAALSLDVKTQTRDGKSINVVHEVHVVVRKPAEVDEISQPKCPPLETHIELPHAEQCRPIVDHLQKVADIIWFGATRDGRFRLAINTTAGEIETLWTNLRNTNVEREKDPDEEGPEEQPDDSAWHLVPLSAKILQKWFSSQILQNHVIAGIAPGYCVVAYIYVGDRRQGGIITYYLPSRNIAFD